MSPSNNPPLKIKILLSPPLFENLVRRSTPPSSPLPLLPPLQQKGRVGSHYENVLKFTLNRGSLFNIILRWCRARDLFGPQIPVTSDKKSLRISYIRNRYLTQ